MNHKKSITHFLIVVVIANLLIGCAPTATNENQEGAEEQTTDAVYEGDAEISENSTEVEVPVFDFLEGGVSYEIDTSRSAELLVEANATKEQAVSLQTDNGPVWTLTIPPNAVDESILIKMSVLMNIESDALGSLQTGVLLEPDGLEFNVPVTLQITGEKMGAHPLLFSGSHDGSEFDFANVTLVEGGVSAALTHFSSAYADPMTDKTKRTKAQEAAEGGYKSIRKFALSFLKEPITVPTPPAIPIRCPANEKIEKERDEALKKFLETFSNPEEEIAAVLLTVGRNEAILTSQNNDGIEIARLLMERLLKKAEALYKVYYPKEEYYIPLTVAVITTERQANLYGSSSSSFLAKTGQWARQIADGYLKAFREQHDYQLLTTMIQMDREASGLGNSKDNSLGEIIKALQFEIQYDAQVTMDLEVGSETISTHGTVPYNGEHFGDTAYYESGKGKYVGFEAFMPDPLTISLNMPASYNFDTRIENFDACRNFSFDLIINKFSADTETYTYSDGENQMTQTEGFMAAYLYAAFEDNVIETLPGREGETFYKFTIPLQNLNATAGEMELTRTVESGSATIKLKLIHTPQK